MITFQQTGVIRHVIVSQEWGSRISNPAFHLRKLGKQGPGGKAGRRKEIVTLRMEIIVAALSLRKWSQERRQPSPQQGVRGEDRAFLSPELEVLGFPRGALLQRHLGKWQDQQVIGDNTSALHFLFPEARPGLPALIALRVTPQIVQPMSSPPPPSPVTATFAHDKGRFPTLCRSTQQIAGSAATRREMTLDGKASGLAVTGAKVEKDPGTPRKERQAAGRVFSSAHYVRSPRLQKSAVYTQPLGAWPLICLNREKTSICTIPCPGTRPRMGYGRMETSSWKEEIDWEVTSTTCSILTRWHRSQEWIQSRAPWT